jgi:hypothetical protein
VNLFRLWKASCKKCILTVVGEVVPIIKKCYVLRKQCFELFHKQWEFSYFQVGGDFMGSLCFSPLLSSVKQI